MIELFGTVAVASMALFWVLERRGAIYTLLFAFVRRLLHRPIITDRRSSSPTASTSASRPARRHAPKITNAVVAMIGRRSQSQEVRWYRIFNDLR